MASFAVLDDIIASAAPLPLHTPYSRRPSPSPQYALPLWQLGLCCLWTLTSQQSPARPSPSHPVCQLESCVERPGIT